MPLGKAIAKDIFKAMAGQGIRPMEMIRIARNFGGTYRKIDMLDDIRAYENRIKYQTLIEQLPSDAKVPKAFMSETILNEPEAKYRVFGEATFVDAQTGDQYAQRVSFYTTDYLDGGGYSDQFAGAYEGKYTEEDFKFTGFTMEALEHNQGYGY